MSNESIIFLYDKLYFMAGQFMFLREKEIAREEAITNRTIHAFDLPTSPFMEKQHYKKIVAKHVNGAKKGHRYGEVDIPLFTMSDDEILQGKSISQRLKNRLENTRSRL